MKVDVIQKISLSNRPRVAAMYYFDPVISDTCACHIENVLSLLDDMDYPNIAEEARLELTTNYATERDLFSDLSRYVILAPVPMGQNALLKILDALYELNTHVSHQLTSCLKTACFCEVGNFNSIIETSKTIVTLSHELHDDALSSDVSNVALRRQYVSSNRSL